MSPEANPTDVTDSLRDGLLLKGLNNANTSPEQSRGVSLKKDDCTLSGRRLRRDERRVEGGDYVDPAGGALITAHGSVEVPPEGMKKGEKLVSLDYNRAS